MRPWSDHHCQASCSAKVAIAASNQQSPKAPCLGCHEGFWHWTAGQQRQNCTKMQNILCLYPASLKSIEHSKQHSTSSTKLSSKPRVSDENIWKHSIELCLLATATHVLRSYAAMQQAFSAVLPWNKHIFESLVWAKGPHDLSSSGGHLTQQISTRHSDTFDMIHFDLWWPIHVFCS